MKNLQVNWITQQPIDKEHKSYVLLGYLQNVKAHFSQEKLYPALSNILTHYETLNALKSRKDGLRRQFPPHLKSADFERMVLHYERMEEDDALMMEIEAILKFSIPKIKRVLNTGCRIYERIEKELTIAPVGFLPMYQQEGYLLLQINQKPTISMYKYSVSRLYQKKEKCLGIQLQSIGKDKISPFGTLTTIKHRLIRKHSALDSVATFSVSSPKAYPFHETLLPIVQRRLMREVIRTAQEQGLS